MKVYFAGSIRGGRDDQELYFGIIKALSQRVEVLTEHIGSKDLTHEGEVGNNEKFIFERDVAWIKESDAVIAEVTQPSLGVGYELGLAESLGKKIICLYRPTEGKKLSAMVRGNGAVKVYEYQTLQDAEKIISNIFST